MYRNVACTFIITVALLVGGCRRQSENTTATTTSAQSRAKVQQIAFVVTTLANPYFTDMVAGAKDEVSRHQRAQLVVQAPEAAIDNERQIRIIEDLIAQKVDVICVVPADSKSIVSVIKKANAAGIPIVVLDNRVDAPTAERAGAKIATFIGSDNFMGGQLAGRYISQRLRNGGRVAILEGVSGVEAASQRKAGFLDAVSSARNIQVVASQAADWDREKALNTTQALLAAQPRLDAIFACNDEMALGAVQAIKSARRTTPLVVVGFDAIDEARAAVTSGELAATVAQLPTEVGRLGVRTAVDILAGKRVPENIPTEVKLITTNALPK